MRKRMDEGATRASTDLVSLVITTRNSSRTLRACLESARAQDYPALELIVVDNASTDGTAEITREFADVAIDAGPERSAQRNAGMRAAHGRWVAILDSDMVLDPDVISSCVKTAEATGSKAIRIPELSFGTGFWSRCRTFEREFYFHDQIVTAARFFDRAHALALGGYDESLTGGEDWDMSMRASSDAVFAPGVIHHDDGRLSLSSIFVKRRYYARGWAAFLRKHGKQGLLRLTPARASLWKNFFRMMRRPDLACGVFVMKSVEVAGAGVGMLSGRDRPAPVYRPASPQR